MTNMFIIILIHLGIISASAPPNFIVKAPGDIYGSPPLSSNSDSKPVTTKTIGEAKGEPTTERNSYPTSFDFSSFPPPFKVVERNPLFTSKYNVSLPANAVPATPPESVGPPMCTAINSNTCSWSCTYPKCLRDQDILSCPSKQLWGLSYDDGPSPNTIPILNYLASINAKATFAVTGTQVVLHPEILLREFLNGHQIIIHTCTLFPTF